MPFVDKYVTLDSESVTDEWDAYLVGRGGFESPIHTQAKAGAISGTALSLASAPACAWPCAPASSHSVGKTAEWNIWKQQARQATRQWEHMSVPLLPQVVQGRAVNPISAPWHRSTSPSRLVSQFSHPGFPQWSISALPWGSKGGP